MAYLQYYARFVQQSIIDRVKAGLTADGWLATDPDDVPFGTTKVEWHESRMEESDLVSVTANMVACTFGNELDDQPQELGGGVTMIPFMVFVDVIGVDDSISVAIAGDIKDRMSGLRPDTSRFEPVYDYKTAPRTAVDGWQIEFEDVRRQRPEHSDVMRLWNVITAEANVYLIGNE